MDVDVLVVEERPDVRLGSPIVVGVALMRTFWRWREHGGVGRSLLIVDDHAGFRSFARALFEAEGYDVVGEAADGESALAEARRLKPEIVLLDVALPDFDGFRVCDELTEGSNGPAIVMTSSRDISSYRRRLERSRAKGFIAKMDLSGQALADLTG